MEICFLEMIDYNVIVHQGLYAKYFFELRSISEEQNYSNMQRKHDKYGLEGWESAKKKSSSQADSLHKGSLTLKPVAPAPPKSKSSKQKSGTSSAKVPRRASLPPPESVSRALLD